MFTTQVIEKSPGEWKVLAQNYNIKVTLESGQSFNWRNKNGVYEGWLNHVPVWVQQESDGFVVKGSNINERSLREYFDLDFDYKEMVDLHLPRDQWINQALEFAPGLRLLHQPVWETLANFICSAVKQIVQIEQINFNLRERFGREISPGRFDFPGPDKIVLAGVEALRECKLGFRAKHLFAAAEAVVQGKLDLQNLEGMPTDEARKQLMQIKGVGEKIANCVLLFSCRKYEVFPVDVWVERALKDLYFAKKRKVTREQLRHFAATQFGEYGGYAQQFLFHWVRKNYRNEAWTASAEARSRK